MKAATILFLAALGWLVIIIAVATIALLIRSQQVREPLMVDAVAPVASANRLFVPCPLTPRNIPNHKERVA